MKDEKRFKQKEDDIILLNGKNKEELKEYKNRLKEIENIDEEE
jgi:hypothetical protein